jgi:Tfp pilus assembly protein PilO
MMLGVIAAVAVIAAAWMLAIKPEREEASTLADEAAQAEQRRDTALASLANAKQARAEFAEAQVGIARLGKAVPADEDIATLVFQLERSARKAGIDFRSVRLEEQAANPTPDSGPGTSSPNGASGIDKVPFKVTFEGSFFELRRFIEHANSFTRMREGKYVSVRGRLIAVEGVSLVAASGGFPQLTAQIAATAYSAPAPKQPTAGGAPATTATPAATTAPADTPVDAANEAAAASDADAQRASETGTEAETDTTTSTEVAR